jgi:hypothetical protein
MLKAPHIDFDLLQLPKDPAQRHEVLVDILGQYFVWLRNTAVSGARNAVSDDGAREKMGPVRWKRYAGVAALSSADQQAACQFAEAAVDSFIRLFLVLLSSIGSDFQLGAKHAARFKLVLEILDIESFEVVDSEVVNRDGEKFFADYWIRWINQHGDASQR